MLEKIFKDLDQWCIQEQKQRKKLGTLRLRPFFIKVVGQTALFEQKMKLSLIETRDVDAYADFDYLIMRQFEALLLKQNKTFDRFSYEIWMPKETEYKTVYKGRFVTGQMAKAEYILISKIKMALRKNSTLLKEYLEKKPSSLFFKLAKKYEIDLQKI